MGTRGLYGVRKNNIDKCTYNHFDSYPDGLGKDFITFIKNCSNQELNKFFEKIKLVNVKDAPSVEDINICVNSGYYNKSVSNQTVEDWYCLLRNLQGNFNEYEKLIKNDAPVIYMTDEISFIKDSLFCEYAYILDLDEKVLEYYEGFQKTPQEGNRYGQEKDGDYYPCKLICKIPIWDIRNYNTEYSLKLMIIGTADRNVVKAIEDKIEETGEKIDFYDYRDFAIKHGIIKND